MGELRTAAVSSRGLQIDIVVPEGIDDPARPSGGNAYDRRIYRELTARGWRVREHAVSGSWPWPDGAAEDALARVVSGIRDGAVVLVDGLIASAAPNVLVPETRRLALVVLVHMPLGDGLPEPELAHARIRERAVLASASAIITTSSWTRQRLIDIYRLRSARIHVAEPGADAATLSPGTASGTELLCVAAVMPHKGHDTLLASLAIIADPSWRCVCVGPLDRDPGFVDGLRRRAETDGLADRIRFAGARSPVSSTGNMPPPTWWFMRPTPRRSAWSSSRPWPADYRSSPPPLVACRMLSVTRLMGGVLAFWCRPGTRTHSASPCPAG